MTSLKLAQVNLPGFQSSKGITIVCTKSPQVILGNQLSETLFLKTFPDSMDLCRVCDVLAPYKIFIVSSLFRVFSYGVIKVCIFDPSHLCSYIPKACPYIQILHLTQQLRLHGSLHLINVSPVFHKIGNYWHWIGVSSVDWASMPPSKYK